MKSWVLFQLKKLKKIILLLSTLYYFITICSEALQIVLCKSLGLMISSCYYSNEVIVLPLPYEYEKCHFQCLLRRLYTATSCCCELLFFQWISLSGNILGVLLFELCSCCNTRPRTKLPMGTIILLSFLINTFCHYVSSTFTFISYFFTQHWVWQNFVKIHT